MVAYLLQSFANTFVRLSFLHLLAYIFSHPRFRLVVYVFVALTAVYMVGCFITFFALCRPLSKNWNPFQKGKCGNQYLAFLLSAIFNLSLDLAIFFLPMPMLWNLQMSTSRKLALTLLFAVGLV